MKVVKDDLVDVLLNSLLFSENDASLSLDVSIAELRVLEDVGEELEHLGRVRREEDKQDADLGDVLLEALGDVDGLFPGGVSIQVSTKVLNLGLNLSLGTRASTL